MLPTLNRWLNTTLLKNNQYQVATKWLSRICNFLISQHKGNNKLMGSSSNDFQFNSFEEMQQAFENNAELVSQFLNKEILSDHNNNVFLSNKVKTEGNVTIIRKTEVDDKALYEVNKPKELSQDEALAFCSHYINLCTQLYKAEQAALLAPENIAETWSAILPPDTEHFQIAEVLIRLMPHEMLMAVYRYANEINPSQEWKQSFFYDELFWDIFEFIGDHRKPADRQVYVTFIKDLIPYFKASDFELLLWATIRERYGDSYLEITWAFAHLYILEVLICDYKIGLDNTLTDKVVELALNEMDEYNEDVVGIDWEYEPSWNEMLNSLGSVLGIGVLSAPLAKRILDYNEIRNNTLQA